MASTNKTANLSLPQWEASDPVERADFNDCFSAIDGNIGRKKLIDYTVQQQKQKIQLDLRSIDLEPFAELCLYFHVSNGMYIRINNCADQKYNFYYHSGTSGTYNKGTLEPTTTHIIITKDKFYIKSETAYSHYYVDRSDFASIDTIELFYDGSNYFQPGDQVTVWGVLR